MNSCIYDCSQLFDTLCPSKTGADLKASTRLRQQSAFGARRVAVPMVALTADSLCSTSACLSSASGSVTIGDARGWNDAFGVGLTAAYGINKLLHVPLNTSIIFKYGGTHTVFVADNEA